MSNYDSVAQIDIAAPKSNVWRALTDPEIIRLYFFGTQVATDWRPGHPITWTGEWQGKAYQDKGVVLEVEPNQHLKFTHFSPLSGASDVPENYHTISIELGGDGPTTHVSLVQDNNKSEEEAAHSTENWNQMLQALKKTVETS